VILKQMLGALGLKNNLFAPSISTYATAI